MGMSKRTVNGDGIAALGRDAVADGDVAVGDTAGQLDDGAGLGQYSLLRQCVYGRGCWGALRNEQRGDGRADPHERFSSAYTTISRY